MRKDIVHNGRRWFNTVRFEILCKFAGIIFPEYRFKWPQMDWWINKDFTSYLELFDELRGFNSDRRWMLKQLIRLVRNVEGDTAECGVYRGAGSYLICADLVHHYTSPKTHFMFDSFEGLSQPSIQDGSYWRAGNLSTTEDSALKNFSSFNNYVILKGWIPSRFAEVSERKFSFVHIDVDLYEPTKKSIDFFYHLMNPGGVILCDDYGFSTCPGASQAFDEYLFDKPEKVIQLCSGGGMIIKGTKS